MSFLGDQSSLDGLSKDKIAKLSIFKEDQKQQSIFEKVGEAPSLTNQEKTERDPQSSNKNDPNSSEISFSDFVYQIEKGQKVDEIQKSSEKIAHKQPSKLSIKA